MVFSQRNVKVFSGLPPPTDAMLLPQNRGGVQANTVPTENSHEAGISRARHAVAPPGVCGAVPGRDGGGAGALCGPSRACGVRASRAVRLARGAVGVHRAGASPAARQARALTVYYRVTTRVAARKEVVSLECRRVFSLRGMNPFFMAGVIAQNG